SVLISAPVGQDLDPQVEEDGRGEQVLDLQTCRAPDLPDTRTTMSDHAPLLAFTFDVDDRPNVHRTSILTELLYRAGNGVWHFVIELLERRLADEFRGKEAQVLGADVIVGVEERPLRQGGGQAAPQLLHPFAGDR